jgi:heme-degrading monooxygenase HmoA
MTQSLVPYVAVIFTSTRSLEHGEEYSQWASRMSDLVKTQPGFISEVSARDPETRFGITISYFKDEESVKNWKAVSEHQQAQRLGKQKFYLEYSVKVATVYREYAVKTAD